MALKAAKTKRGKKESAGERAADDHGAMGSHNGRLHSMTNAKQNLHSIKLACGYLQRKKDWELEDLTAFVRRVFDAVGV